MDPFANLFGPNTTSTATTSTSNPFAVNPALPSPSYGNNKMNQGGVMSNENAQLKQQLQVANHTIAVLRQQLEAANKEISMLKLPKGRPRTTSVLLRKASFLANNQYYTTDEKDMTKLKISKGDESIIVS